MNYLQLWIKYIIFLLCVYIALNNINYYINHVYAQVYLIPLIVLDVLDVFFC